ncbi:hypothetical protein SO802_009177 [Lithocarpus litseifolius]|uniref:Uncharacterized protein n=1 Tax=Lithocarpus litseifolius TaxID=425828 RepID=A0AAW2DEQ3_9ROSI
MRIILDHSAFCAYSSRQATVQTRYAQDAQHVDQNNCRRVPRRVCPVLLTVEGHWQRRFVLVSRRMEELYLGKKKVPRQLAALIEGQKCKEVGEHQWCTYAVHRSHCRG